MYEELLKYVTSVITQAAQVKQEVECVTFTEDQASELLDLLKRADDLMDDALTTAKRED